MFAPTRAVQRVLRRVFSIGAYVAMAAQMTLAVVPIAEGNAGRGTAAHVEAGGTAVHFAHNDATCATCQARSLNGIAIKATPTVLVALSESLGYLAPRDRVAIERLSPSASPRAPPSVI